VSWATECYKVVPKVFSVMTAVFFSLAYKNMWPHAPSRKCQITGLLFISRIVGT